MSKQATHGKHALRSQLHVLLCAPIAGGRSNMRSQPGSCRSVAMLQLQLRLL